MASSTTAAADAPPPGKPPAASPPEPSPKNFSPTSASKSVAFIAEIGGIAIAEPDYTPLPISADKTLASPIFCPDTRSHAKNDRTLEKAKTEGDSLGGIFKAVAFNLPIGLGDPVYGKLEAKLASAMLSLPATKGFEIGSGFAAARMKGSEHNDAFDPR